MNYFIYCTLILLTVYGTSNAQRKTALRIEYKNDWIVASHGADESLQSIQLKIWGSLRDSSFFQRDFAQIDDDEESEYLIISRNPGTGPYYKLQIVDLRIKGISIWQYDSFGKPKVDGKNIKLGKRVDNGQPASLNVKYVVYRFTKNGLEEFK